MTEAELAVCLTLLASADACMITPRDGWHRARLALVIDRIREDYGEISSSGEGQGEDAV